MILGLGQYKLNRDQYTADPAPAVRDEYQGQSAGMQLLYYLTFLA